MELLNAAAEYVNKAGVVGLLIVIVVALVKGWVVSGREYKVLLAENARLMKVNAELQKTIGAVTEGLARPVRQTLDAIPTPEVVS